ncbi:MAG: hypothetical protein AB7V48_04465 [Sedimentibacter sp.]
MKGRLIDLSFGMNRKQRITIEVDADFREKFNQLKDSDISIEIKKYREKRSKDANAYFHVLVNKIAETQGLGNDEVKKSLVIEYGALAKDDEGNTVGFKLPVSVKIESIYPYAKVFDIREENNRIFNCYLVYKHTHEMDNKEMARLIDGAIYVAKDLGIETDTPEQLARYKEEWGRLG